MGVVRDRDEKNLELGTHGAVLYRGLVGRERRRKGWSYGRGPATG
jgi:hypothetical protein